HFHHPHPNQLSHPIKTPQLRNYRGSAHIPPLKTSAISCLRGDPFGVSRLTGAQSLCIIVFIVTCNLYKNLLNSNTRLIFICLCPTSYSRSESLLTKLLS